MTRERAILIAGAVALALSGCATAKEKTAPCKRPGLLSSYAAAEECETRPVNDASAQAAIQALQLGTGEEQ